MIHNCTKEEQRRISGMAVGDFVMYTDEPDVTQVRWGGNDHPTKAGMKLGEIYEVADVEIHDSYSQVRFYEVMGKFNSLSFVIIDPADSSDAVDMRDQSFQRAETAKHKFAEEFREKATRWIVNIQKCGLTLLNDCQDCQFHENCSAIRDQLILMQHKLKMCYKMETFLKNDSEGI
jgi:hypothetical protein